ncbi:MAG: NAD(P)/FAD-dependent oxidoreductase [Aeromicrobium sp.]|uniref:flavin-containing monooxygenase n=1 Tax=Aeromicrobium sp. TaxID=1871063 RepID=UPI0039E58DD4
MISTDILIIGTGFSGMGMAMKLREAGRTDFIVLEKADDVGGTWRDNTYPGAECDIQSHMYSFSYELNPHWSREYSGQAEIWEYMRSVAKKHDLYDVVHFGTEMTGATWDEERQRWTVTTSKETYDARVLVSGIGGLHIPNIPDIEGAETFTGPRFHSAQWDHDVDLTGKRVAVIGTGASAIQFIPQIAPEVAQLDVHQRTAPWVIPKMNHDIQGTKKTLISKLPGSTRAYRNALYWFNESTQLGFTGPMQNITGIIEKKVAAYIRKTINDPETAEKLIPDYRLGCKRVLKTDNYIPVYNRDNVKLIDTGVAEITPTGVRTKDGDLREVDVIIYGTGFHVTDAFDWIRVKGEGGRDLSDTFNEHGIETYNGITVSHFPNFFMLLGPNTALGHNSVVFMIEQQTKWIIKLLAEMDARGAGAVQPTPQAQREFNDKLQEKVSKGVWSQGGCTSWYLDSQGKNRTIWPGFTFRYWSRLRTVPDRDFIWHTAVKEKQPA